MSVATYEVYALRYAKHAGRKRKENFVSSDIHDEGIAPFDFYFWLVKNDERCVLVDTGFNQAMALKRNREFIAKPSDLLRDLDINAVDVEHVIVTHMHYDHIGNLNEFPRARLYMQEKEMRYCTGKAMTHRFVRAPYDPGNISDAIHRLFAGKVKFLNDEEEIFPGIMAYHVGGHTDGMQIITVNTTRGSVVLASDAAHYWENLKEGEPFPIVSCIPDMLAAHKRIQDLAPTIDHVIPGHDPGVRERFPQYGFNENIVQIHLPPEK